MKREAVAFFGSPAFALPVLEAIHKHFPVVLVVTQPAKPSGRGLQLAQPSVAMRALELNLPLLQPERLRKNEDFARQLQDSGASVAVTCAYGKILPASLLDIPKFGFLNVHTSLLPKYRGAAPIQWALIQGETSTGVTIMRTDAGLDTGPILLQESLEISSEETSRELAPRLAELGSRLILQALEQIGTFEPQPQDDVRATFAPLLSKDDGRIRWQDSAQDIWNRFRGVIEWPGSWFVWQGKRVKALELERVTGSGVAGTVLAIDDSGLVVAAGEGAIRLNRVQVEGKRAIHALEWANGYRVSVGDFLE